MIDRNVVTAKLLELDRRVRRIASLRKSSASEYASDETSMELTAFNLMLAVQCVSDIAAHLITDQNWQPVTTNAEAFDRLSEHHVVPKDLASALRKAVGFRNAVAHGYLQLRADLLHQAATGGLDDSVAFSRHVVAWLSSQA